MKTSYTVAFEKFLDSYNDARKSHPVLTRDELRGAFDCGSDPIKTAKVNDKLASEYDVIYREEMDFYYGTCG